LKSSQLETQDYRQDWNKAMELSGRAALVTGGAGGIGAAVVSQLARAGISGVAINYRKAAKVAEELADENNSSRTKALAIHADVQSGDGVRRMMDKIHSHFGRLDVLVNNAGMTHWVELSNLEALTEQIWDEILDVNIKGAFRCTRAAGQMLAEHQGMVINVS